MLWFSYSVGGIFIIKKSRFSCAISLVLRYLVYSAGFMLFQTQWHADFIIFLFARTRSSYNTSTSINHKYTCIILCMPYRYVFHSCLPYRLDLLIIHALSRSFQYLIDSHKISQITLLSLLMITSNWKLPRQLPGSTLSPWDNYNML